MSHSIGWRPPSSLSPTTIFTPGRFPWLGGHPAAILVGGPHLYDDHLPALDAFLARTAKKVQG